MMPLGNLHLSNARLLSCTKPHPPTPLTFRCCHHSSENYMAARFGATTIAPGTTQPKVMERSLPQSPLLAVGGTAARVAPNRRHTRPGPRPAAGPQRRTEPSVVPTDGRGGRLSWRRRRCQAYATGPQEHELQKRQSWQWCGRRRRHQPHAYARGRPQVRLLPPVMGSAAAAWRR